MSDKAIIRVKDVMKPDVDIIDGKMTVKDALNTMKHVETKSLIVAKKWHYLILGPSGTISYSTNSPVGVTSLAVTKMIRCCGSFCLLRYLNNFPSRVISPSRGTFCSLS